MKLRGGFAFTILVVAAACGGTVDTRSSSRGVGTGTGGNGATGTPISQGGYPIGGQIGNGGFQFAGAPTNFGGDSFGPGGSLAGSCNPIFCQPDRGAPGCCVTSNGPCGVDYGTGCTQRGCSGRDCLIPPPPLPSCSDGVLNGVETDVDCGGPTCSLCSPGNSCRIAQDCWSPQCIAGVCGPPGLDAGPPSGCDGSACTPGVDGAPSPPEGSPAPTCSDSVKNGTETDVDCGGSCPPCRVGNACIVADDCVTRNCFGNHVCGTAECTDGMYNGLETDVDCGGSCARCPTGKHCLVYSDCASFVCAGATCMAPSCADGVRNGNEVCVDCGGACPPCSNCPSD